MPSEMQPRKERRLKAGETAIVADTAIYGRMRQRIVAVGRTGASHRRTARDKYLHGLLRSGAITPNDLDSAIDGCSKALSELAWLTGVDDAVLARADCVFLLSHGRFPVDDGDFRLNGDYHRICRSLQFDPHYYDRQLEQLPQALEAQRMACRAGGADIRVRPSVPDAPITAPSAFQGTAAGRTKPSVDASMAVRRGNAWAFAGVLAIGLVTAPIFAMVIVQSFPQVTMTAGLSICGAWLALLAGALALTLPRRRG
jgi:hypothetical protein